MNCREQPTSQLPLRQLLLSVLMTCSAGSAITADLISAKPHASDRQIEFGNSGPSITALSIRTGDTVIWQNTGSMSHSLQIGNQPQQRLYAREHLETRFTQAGDYRFECTTHRKKGQIHVSGPSVAAATPVSPAPATPDTPVEVPTGNAISITEQMQFSPQRLVVKAGTTVIWTNDDYSNHIVEFTGQKSPRLRRGASFSYSFTQAGEYPYICAIHGKRMNGTVVVED